MIFELPSGAARVAGNPLQWVPHVLDYHERSQLAADRSPKTGTIATSTVRHGGTTRIPLARPALDDHPGPSFDTLFTRRVAPREIGPETFGGFVFDALALSTRWTGPGGWRRRPRVFPSLAGAYPTQAHLACGPQAGFGGLAGVYHYTALDHALERRRVILDADWASITEPLPSGAFLVGLSTVPSRLEPVSGIRAPRDAHLEIGHALAAVHYSAAIRGWQCQLVDTVPDSHQARCFALDRRLGQRPAALVAVFPRHGTVGPPMLEIPAELLDRWASEPAEGTTNLRPVEDPEPALTAAIRYGGLGEGSLEVDPPSAPDGPAIDRRRPARPIVRRRRHAMAFDTEIVVGRSLFVHLLRQLCPEDSTVPWSTLPWRPCIAPLVLVHRVQGFEPGVYVLGRHAEQLPSLRAAAGRDGLLWQSIDADGLDLQALRFADVRESAELICCQQTTAGDGAFTVVLLAEVEPALRWHGPWFYPRLFWEAGAVAHTLALEAEAADLSAALLSRFHDPLVHVLLGLDTPAWRAIYAVGVGQRIDDPRIRASPAYRDILTA